MFIYFSSKSGPVLPVLLWRQAGAAAAVAVHLLHGAAHVVVTHVQHVEASSCAVYQRGAVQEIQTALCERRLHTQINIRTAISDVHERYKSRSGWRDCICRTVCHSVCFQLHTGACVPGPTGTVRSHRSESAVRGFIAVLKLRGGGGTL